MGIAYILTVRGIPQIYYGTEILMTSPAERSDGLIRSDFPGGWKGDTVNVFKEKGLNDQQRDAISFMKTLLNWRQNKSCLHEGKMIHYAPEKGTYVYFRLNDKEKVMIAINKNNNEVILDGSRFEEVIGPSVVGKEVISDKVQSLQNIIIPSRSVLIIEF